MNILQIRFFEDGTLECSPDFKIIRGSYRNILMNVEVPHSLLLDPVTELDSNKAVTGNSVRVAAVIRTVVGKTLQTQRYDFEPVKDHVVDGVMHRLYQRVMPREFTLWETVNPLENMGSGQLNLIFNIVNWSKPNPDEDVKLESVVVSQTLSLDVYRGAFLEDMEVIKNPDNYSYLKERVNELNQELDNTKIEFTEKTEQLSENKLDKAAGDGKNKRVYIIMPDGTQTTAIMIEQPQAGCIPMYTSGGQLNCAIPVTDTQVANKGYTDTQDKLLGAKVELSIDTNTYVMSLVLKNTLGAVLSTTTVDFPLESMVVNGSYADGKVTLTLKNGQTVEFSIADLVKGLVSETDFDKEVDRLDTRINTEKSALVGQINTVQSDLNEEVQRLDTKIDTEKNTLEELISTVQSEVNAEIQKVNDTSGASVNMSLDSSTYVLTLSLVNSAGKTLSTKTVDFPVESMVVNGSYSNGTLTLTLKNGNKINVNISDLVSGLVPNSRKVNGKTLSSDITLNASDVGAYSKAEIDQKIYELNLTLTDIENRVRALEEKPPIDPPDPPEKDEKEKIYGVAGVGSEDPNALIRIDDAKDLSYKVVGNGINSDFDSCYPWNEMEEVSENDSIFIKIPKFYQQITRAEDGTYTHRISGTQHPGFDTLFRNSAGDEIDYILVGKYELSNEGRGRGLSVPNADVAVDIPIESAREMCRVNGEEFYLYDFVTDSILKELFLVEFATTDSESVMKGYTNGSAAISTGRTDGILTGSDGDLLSGEYAMTYRGIENLYGNVMKFIDGIAFNGEEVYVCFDQRLYGLYDKYQYMGTRMIGQGYISRLDTLENHTLLQYVSECAETQGTYYSDIYFNEDESDSAGIVTGSYFIDTGGMLGLWSLLDSVGDISFCVGGRMCWREV